MELVKEFYRFFITRKKFWLLPILLVFILLGLLIVFTNGSAVTPFIYSLF